MTPERMHLPDETRQAPSHCSILSRSGTPPACTTFPSITNPGMLITP